MLIDSMTEVDILQTVARLIVWLAVFIKFTEEEQEAAGIYCDHPGGE
jgi:hypothetical protein